MEDRILIGILGERSDVGCPEWFGNYWGCFQEHHRTGSVCFIEKAVSEEIRRLLKSNHKPPLPKRPHEPRQVFMLHWRSSFSRVSASEPCVFLGRKNSRTEPEYQINIEFFGRSARLGELMTVRRKTDKQCVVHAFSKKKEELIY